MTRNHSIGWSIIFSVLFFSLITLYVMVPICAWFFELILALIPVSGTLFVYFASYKIFTIKKEKKHFSLWIATVIIIMCFPTILYCSLYIFFLGKPVSNFFTIWMILPIMFFSVIPLCIGMIIGYLKAKRS